MKNHTSLFRAGLAVVRILFNLGLLLIFAFVRFLLQKLGLSNRTQRVELYLEGNFGPVSDQLRVSNLVIQGTLPADLDGEFVRNGPNTQFKEQVYDSYHWFDGDGMLHAVRLENGSATYVNRWVETSRWKEERAAGKSLYVRLGHMRDPVGMLRAIASSIWTSLRQGKNKKKRDGKGTANTALAFHDGRLLALVENDAPYGIHLPFLETIGKHDYEGKLSHPFTAHPKVDPRTGELMFFGYRFDKKPYVLYSVVDKEGQLQSTLGISSVEVPVMMHDFAVSENYSVILELPFTFRIERALQGEPVFQFESDRGSRFGLIPRHARSEAEIKWFTGKPGFVFHTVNCWEDGDEVILLACRSDATSSLGLSEDMEGARLRSDPRFASHLYEWRFHLKSHAVLEQRLDTLKVEFPVINESLMGRKTRFTYTAHLMESEMPLMDGVVKYDLENRKNGQVEGQLFRYGKGKTGGECIFVPRQEARSEDDGYLLTFVYDEQTNESSLWVMDALNFGGDKTVLAIVKLPQRVPYGFHGKWITQEQILHQKEWASHSSGSSP